jgi:hypothetical protein
MRFLACVSLALVALVANPLAETKIMRIVARHEHRDELLFRNRGKRGQRVGVVLTAPSRNCGFAPFDTVEEIRGVDQPTTAIARR